MSLYFPSVMLCKINILLSILLHSRFVELCSRLLRLDLSDGLHSHKISLQRLAPSRSYAQYFRTRYIQRKVLLHNCINYDFHQSYSGLILGESSVTLPLDLARCSRLIPLFRGCVGHAFRKSTAGAFGPDLAKKLAILVKMEKNVMRSMELVGRERMEVAVSCPRQSAVPTAILIVEYSNNSQSGVRVVMTMFRTLRTNLVS